MTTGPDPGTRVAVLSATVDEVADSGLGHLTMEAVARRAGVGRATVYRYFPDGRDQLIGEAITWEVSGFFTDLAARIDEEVGFRRRLERGLVFAHRSLTDHRALQRLLAEDRERLLVRLHALGPMLVALIGAYLAPYLETERLRPGVEPAAAADHIARLVLSFIVDPGSWDLADRDAVADLVETQIVAGILADDGAVTDGGDL